MQHERKLFEMFNDCLIKKVNNHFFKYQIYICALLELRKQLFSEFVTLAFHFEKKKHEKQRAKGA